MYKKSLLDLERLFSCLDTLLFFQGHGFSSQHPHHDAEVSVILVPEEPLPSSDHALHKCAVEVYICSKTAININLKW